MLTFMGKERSANYFIFYRTYQSCFMSIAIRKAERSDAPAAYQLIKELALFEEAPKEVINTLAQFTEDRIRR